MDTHDEVEAILDADEQVFSVIDIEVELSFEGFVNMDTSLNANLVIFRIPVSLISYWNSLPSIRIHVSKSFSYAPNDSFSENVRLLVQMVMVGIRVVKTSSGDVIAHNAHWHYWLHLWHSHWCGNSSSHDHS